MAEKIQPISIVKFSSLNIVDRISSSIEYSNLETYSLLWLEPSASETKQYFDAQQRFRTLINYVKIFKTTDECEQYLKLVPQQDRILFVVNHQTGQELIPRIHQLPQIFAIYIYSSEPKRYGQWTKEFAKIKSVHMQLDSLIAQIKSDRARRSHNKIDEPANIYTFHKDVDFKQNNRFIRGQLLVDCLLGLPESPTDRPKLIEICQEHYKENKNELSIVREFQENYAATRSIRWFTRQSFLSRILQKALRMENIDLLFLFRFFVHDLQKQIIKNQPTQPQRLYRSQLINVGQFEILKKTVGGFLLFNTFLSTTVDRDASLAHFDQLDQSDEFEMKRILFEIDADPNIEGMKPFANIIWLSYSFGQQEVLITIGSIFRVIDIQEDQQAVTVVRLCLCSDLDAELKQTFEQLRRDYRVKDMNLLNFGHVLSDLTTFEDAKKFYLHLLKDLPSDHQDLATCYHALGNVAAEKGDLELCLEWYEKLLILLSQTLKSDDPRLADTHSMIGNIHRKKNDNKNALDSFSKALIIYKQTFDENHLAIAECSDRIAEIYEKEKKFFQALNHYEKSLSIRQKHFDPEHLEIAGIHSKLGGVRLALCHYYLALGHYNTAMKIKSNTLSADHIDFASDYRGMGHIYRARGELSQALNYYKKSFDIYRTVLPADDPIIVEIDRSIRFLSTQTK